MKNQFYKNKLISEFQNVLIFSLVVNMAESPESPTRYSLPPEEKLAKAKKPPTRKRKAPVKESTQAEPGKIQNDIEVIGQHAFIFLINV